LDAIMSRILRRALAGGLRTGQSLASIVSHFISQRIRSSER
jgi:hypothetical protein